MKKFTYVGFMMLFAFVMTYVMLQLMVANKDDFLVGQSLFDEAAFMACIMGVVEIAMMNVMEIHPSSAEDKMQDFFWIAVLSLATIWFAYRIRYAKGITSRKEFYLDMIPHHSTAVRMIQEVQSRPFAQQDDIFRKFLSKIKNTQEKEIIYMKQQLDEASSRNAQKTKIPE